MRFGLLSQWYTPEPGGGAIPGLLANSLADREHTVRVLTGFPNYPSGAIYPGYHQRWRHLEHPRPGVTVRRAPLYASHNGNPVARVANYLSFGATAMVQAKSYFHDLDALWVYNSPATVGSVARRLAKRGSVPYLIHVMDVWPDSALESGMLSSGTVGRAVGAQLEGVVRRTHDAASMVAVTSRGQRDLLHSRGVPWSKLRYIPVWADEAVFHPRAGRRELLPTEAQQARLVVMYAGAMGHVQRLDEAVRAVAASGPEVHLVMVGSGVAERSLRRLVDDLGATNVHFMGSHPAAAMGDISAAADIHLVSLIDTPLMRVTMPSKIPSVMALGKPILANCAGDAARTVEIAQAGVSTTPGSVKEIQTVLAELLRDPSVLTTWGEAGRAFYEKEFAQAKAVARVESALLEIVR